MAYWLNGAQITQMTHGNEWMHFYYDGQGRPSIMNYVGNTYHYLYALQGDVIGLVDSSGTLVVEYKYDAWGYLLGKTGSLASTLGTLNPFRYGCMTGLMSDRTPKDADIDTMSAPFLPENAQE